MNKLFHTFLLLTICSFVFAQVNLTANGTASQSSDFGMTQGLAAVAIDGNTDGNWGNGSVSHTTTEQGAWWEVDLFNSTAISHVVLYNRTDCCQDRLTNFYVFVSGAPFTSNNVDDLIADNSIFKVAVEAANNSISIPINFGGRYVRVQLTGNNPLSLAEVEVYQLIGSQLFQTVNFTMGDKFVSTGNNVQLEGTASSGLPVSYTVISGPGVINGDQLSFTGVGGELVIGAFQTGGNNFAASDTTLFTSEVIDPSTVFPVVNISTVTESYDLAMPTLKPIDIYANASIDHPEIFKIIQIDFEINGNLIEGTRNKDGLFYFTFEPTTYGLQTLTATATGNNGISTSVDQDFTIVNNVGGDFTIMAIDNAEIIWTQTSFNVYQTINLPTQLDSYNNIEGHLFIDCPDNANCDPWDRILKIRARKPGGAWTEIIRYISPYLSVCDHYIDLTDYMHLLKGEVEFHINYVTYSEGRRIDLELEFTESEPDYTYYNIDHLWNNTLDFGDPNNLQPADTITFAPHENLEDLKLKLVSTGHGWGASNTESAAEFRNSTHTLYANNSEFIHNPWELCDPNPDGCIQYNLQGYFGTWWFPRAGWCPGAIAHGDEYDFTEMVDEESIDFWLMMDTTYQDFCHPNNPDCISGTTTCEDCNAGFNPHYVMMSNLISKSNSIMSEEEVELTDVVIIDTSFTALPEMANLEIAVYPNPTSHQLNLYYNGNTQNLNYKLSSLNGAINIAGNFNNNTETINVQELPKGIYVLNVERNNEIVFNQKVVIQ